MSLVEVEALKKRYGSNEIVKGVSFQVAEGEVLGLVGSSGGGKSTILRCINYLTPFEEGEIRLAGHRLVPGLGLTDPAVRAARRDAGMVFQDFQLFPHLTALQNVALGPTRVLGMPVADAEARAAKLLARVKLSDKAELFPSQLSGGQKQRVGIARALAMAPKVLLLDEPTSALDPELKGEVASVIVDLKRTDRMTMILVTHEVDLARAACDRVMRLKGGLIEASGPPAQVL